MSQPVGWFRPFSLDVEERALVVALASRHQHIILSKDEGGGWCAAAAYGGCKRSRLGVANGETNYPMIVAKFARET